MRAVCFTLAAFEQYTDWQTTDKTVLKKLNKLIVDTAKNPFSGIGKPEPLKHDFKGYWSKRITDEHRLVYRVDDHTIFIIACKYHY